MSADYNDVRYSPYLRRDGVFTIICWQWFDFDDYRPAGFIVLSENNKIQFGDANTTEYDVLKFADEEKAINWMLTHILSEHIDDEYKQADNTNINTYLRPEYRGVD